MNPYVLFALLGAILAAGAGGFKLGVDHEVAAQAREDAHIAQAVDAATAVAAQHSMRNCTFVASRVLFRPKSGVCCEV